MLRFFVAQKRKSFFAICAALPRFFRPFSVRRGRRTLHRRDTRFVVRDGALDVPPARKSGGVFRGFVANVDFKNRICYDISTGLYLQSRIDERGVKVEKIRLWNDEASADRFGG